MKNIATATLLTLAAFIAPSAAPADTSPLANRIIVQQALQNQMQNQLNTQSVQLQSQQDLTRQSLQSQLQQEILQMQFLQLQQQMNLNDLRLNAAGSRSKARSSNSHKARKRSH